MTDLRALLKGKGVKKAVVIDDVFDETPRPDELDAGDWSIFFDDLGNEGRDKLEELFPGFEETNASDLQESQEFLNVLWANRNELLQDPIETLFSDYESTNATEREKLEKIVQTLESLDLTCIKMGRDPGTNTDDADLIIIDLFLGRNQSGDDVMRAIERVRDLVTNRAENPPLVILTSRSSRLNNHRDDFRDKAGLLGSTFRVASKSHLSKDGSLEAILLRLARHYEDAKKVAGFVYAWDRGLNEARKNFVCMLRRLDLSDIAQIRALLLDHEGECVGEYLLDVADRVLQHEIENDGDTIAAALELNKIDLDKYPAPHLTGSLDLQDLVYRMVFQHRDRLRLSEDNGKPALQFGDVLRWKKEDNEVYGNQVSLVVTPACDLIRGGAKRVMLLSGRLEELQPKDWSYKAGPVRTAIIILPDGGRKWIRWNLKDVWTLGWDKLDEFLGDGEGQCLKRIGRLRELYAIEIQEMLLADLGRIGRPTNMPVPFPVTVSFFYVDTSHNAKRLEVEGVESAACYVGRGQNSKSVHRLVLAEQACDKIEQALLNIAEDSVHSSAKASLSAVKEDRGFFTKFERGEVEISPEKGTKLVKAQDNKIYASMVRGEELEEGTPVSGSSRKAAIIIKVTDVLE